METMLKLLIVDDKPSEREGIKNIIDWKEAAIEIVGEAENGLEGIEKARSLKPDIIITDVVMPKADGFKMIEEIKKFLPDIKVIFISCFDNFNFVKSAIDVNAMGYVLKPIIASELFATINKVAGIHLKEMQKRKEKEDLLRRLRESLPILREQFVKDIIYNTCNDEEELWNKNEFLQLGFKPGKFLTMIIEINDYDIKMKDTTEEKKQIKCMEIKEFISSICKTYKHELTFYITNIDNSRFVVIFNFTDIQCFNIEDFSEKLKNDIFEKFQFEITICISSTVDYITGLGRCYQESCDALKFKSFLGSNYVIKYSDIYSGNISDVKFQSFNTTEIHREIKYLLMTGDPKEIDLFIENLFRVNNQKMDYQYIQYICISIIYYIQINLIEMNESLSNIFDDEFTISKKFLKYKTITDIKQWLKNAIRSVSSCLNEKSNSKNKKVIEIMKEFIYNHYAEDLSVSDIAREVYLSPCYANYVFKKETGKTLIEFLTEIRIEKAKHLLKNSLLKVYEISEKVGYKNNSYFCAVFKERCGITPLEYRGTGVNL